MKFWEAMKALEEGKRVRCLTWDEIVPPLEPLETEKEPFVCTVSVNYEGLNKSSWELYEEPEKTYSFAEVVKGLKEGKKYKRKIWDGFPGMGNMTSILAQTTRGLIGLSFEDFEATDWIEVE